MVHRIDVVDSHTAGEPTRLVIRGGPSLGAGTAAQRLVLLRERFDRFRSAIINEPRGSDVLVGALLLEPSDPSCSAAVIFFNNVGYLGMCGHGTIGLVHTLAYLNRIGIGMHRIETPVGVVSATVHSDGTVSFENVAAWRKTKDLTVNVSGFGPVSGDVAWGGNWFFLVNDTGLDMDWDDIDQLSDFARRIRLAVNAGGFPQVDHVEIFGPPTHAQCHSRNFVLCPGNAYDRSPCGTGTSAKLACLAADAKLAEGQEWVQQGILGTRFTGRYRREADAVIATITGSAHVTAEATLILDENDPFCWGIT